MGVWKKMILNGFCVSTLSSVPGKDWADFNHQYLKRNSIGRILFMVPGKGRSWIGSAYQGFYRCLERTGRISFISISKGIALGGCYLWVSGKRRSWADSAYQRFHQFLERTGRISTISTSKGTALGGRYLWVPGKRRSWIGSANQGFYRCLEWTGRILFIVP